MPGSSTEMYRVISDAEEVRRIKEDRKHSSSIGVADGTDQTVEFVLEHPDDVYTIMRVPANEVEKMKGDEYTLDEALFAIALRTMAYNRPINDSLRERDRKRKKKHKR